MSHETDLTDPHLPDGQTLWGGQFTITRRLDAGGFGITYMAKDKFGRDVVIKECFPAGLSRRVDGTRVTASAHGTSATFEKCIRLFLDEAETLAKLSSPHVVNVQTSFEENGTAYMVMEFVDGKDLQKFIKEDFDRLTPPFVQGLTEKILKAVLTVHDARILHRDIKPANILIDQHDRPVLIDFGAARVEATRQSRELSASLRVVSDGYSPNEFYITGVPHGPESDLYSVGATIYALITGQPPVEAPQRHQMISDNRPDPVQPLAGTVEGYSDIFLQCIDQALALPRRDRLHSAKEWLRRIAPEDSTFAPPVDPAVAADPRPAGSRRRLGAILLGSTAGLLIGAAAVAMFDPAGAWIDERLGREAAMLPSEAEDLQRLVRQTQGALEDRQADLDAAEREAARLAAELERAQAAESEQIAALRAERDAAQDRIAALQARLDEAERGAGRSTRELETALAAARARIAQLQGDLARADASGSDEVAALRTALEDARTRIADLQQDMQRTLDDRSARIASLEGDLRAARAEADRLAERLQSAETQGGNGAARLTAQLRDAEGRAEDLRDRLRNAQQAQIDLQRRVVSLTTRIGVAEAERDDLLRQVQDLTAQIALFQPARPDTGGTVPVVQPAAAPQPAPGPVDTAGWRDADLRSEVLQGHLAAVTAVALSPDSRLILSGAADGELRLWDRATGQTLRSLRQHQGAITSVAFSPDGESFLSASDDDTLRLWNTETLEPTARYEIPGPGDAAPSTLFAPYATRAAYAPGGDRIAAGLTNMAVRVWDGAAGETDFTGHADWVTAIAFDNDGDRIASGSFDTSLRLWDAATGATIASPAGHDGPVTAVAFSPDGSILASGGSAPAIRLWDAETGRALRSGDAGAHIVTDLAYGPQGDLIVSASEDDTLRLWDAGSLQTVRTLTGHDGDVTAVAFSADGRFILSASEDRTLRLWSFQP